MDGVGRCPWLLLLLLSGLALDRSYGWRPKQEYVYQLEGRTVTSFLSLHTYGVGIHYRATVHIQAVSHTSLLLKVQDARYAKVQEDMPETWWVHFKEPGAHWQRLPLTDTTIIITHEDGVVKTVVHSPDLEEWEVNFIQGIAGHLQANLAAGGEIFSPELDNAHGRKRRTQDSTIYKVMESGVAGRCEVLYEVAKLSRTQAMLGSDWPDNTDACGGRSLLEITKSTNYSRCERTAEYHVGLPAATRGCNAGSNLCGDFWQRVFVTRMRGCGDHNDFTVLDSVGTSRQLANIHLHEESGATINSYVNLSLVSTQPVDSFFPTESSPRVQKDLAYFYVPQALEEGGTRSPRSVAVFPNQRHRHHEARRPKAPVQPDASSSEEEREYGKPDQPFLPPPDRNNPQQLAYCPQYLSRRSPEARPHLVQEFRDTLRNVAADMDNPAQLVIGMSLEKLEGAVVACRSMTRSELESAVEDTLDSSQGHSETERKLVMDALAMCGTHPSFSVIKERVESKKIVKESAADLVASLSDHISAPTQSLLDDFASLVLSPAVKKDQQLLISAVLAFSNLVRTACSNHNTKKSFYTTETFSKDACSARSAEKYLRLLVNLSKHTPGLQAVMMTALGNTGLPGALPLLASVAGGDSSVYARSMAVFSMRHHALMHPKSTLPLLLGLFQKQENPVAVRMAAVALIWHSSPQLTVWQRIAVSTWYEKNPALVAFITSSLASFADTDSPGWEHMKKNAQAAIKLSKPASIGLEQAYNVIWSTTSDKLKEIVLQQLEWIYNFKFSTLYYHSTSRLGEFPWHNGEVELDIANPGSFLTSLKELVAPSDDIMLSRPPLKDIPRSTWDISKSLNLALNAMPSVEGALRIKTGHLMERMWPFGKKIKAELEKVGRSLVSELHHSKEFHLQKASMKMFMVEATTEMGFPVSLKLSVPSATRVSGQAKVTEDNHHLAFEVSGFYARHLVAELMVYTAWDRSIHLAGSQGCAVVTAPAVRLNARLDPQAGLLQVEVKPGTWAPTGSTATVNHLSWPYVAQRDPAQVSVLNGQKTIRVGQPKKVEYRSSKLLFKYESDDPRGVNDLFDNSVSVLGFPVWPDLRASSVTLQLSKLPAFLGTFGLGKAVVKKGDIHITKAPWARNDWPEDILSDIRESVMIGDTEERQEDISVSSMLPVAEMMTTDEMVSSIISQEDVTIRTYSEEGSLKESTEECLSDEDTESEGDQDEERAFFLARNLDPHGPTVNGTSYLLKESLKDFYNGRAFVVSAIVSVDLPRPKIFSAFWFQADQPLNLEHKMGLFVKEITSDWQLAFGYHARESLLPLFNIEEEILSNLSSTVYSDLELRVSDKKYAVTFLGEATHREGTPASIMKSWMKEGCMPEEFKGEPLFNKKCRQLLDKSTSYDLYSASVTCSEEVRQLVPAETTIKEGLESAGIYLDEESKTVRSNQLSRNKLQLAAYLAANRKRMDVVITTPGRTSIYKDIETGIGPADQYGMRRYGNIFKPSTCIVGKNKIATYDGVVYEYGINSCWHVATMDCSGQNKVAVLSRMKGREMEVEVNADNYKVISLLPGPRVFVNEQQLHFDETNMTQVQDDNDVVLAELSLSPDNAITLELRGHGLRVLYDRSAVVVQSSVEMEGRMCGLCGNQDGELGNEFTGPSGGLLSTAQDFGRSFILQHSDCQTLSAIESSGLC